MDWALLPLRRYADFSGRSRRKEYWAFFLAVTILTLMLLAWFAIEIGTAAYESAQPSSAAGVIISLYAAMSFALFIPSLAVQVRRFHDMDKSGWHVLLNFVPLVGFLIVLVFMFQEGTRGPNEFGPDPKMSDAAVS